MNQDLNIKELLAGDLARLSHVWRFTGDRFLFKQNVLEHTAQVAIFAMFVADWVQENAEDVNMETLLRAALLHDFEEAVAGDVRRPFKELLKSCGEDFSVAKRKALDSVLGAVWPRMANEYALGWKAAKDESFEGRILEFADFLSALAIIYQEKLAGNERVVHDTRSCPVQHFPMFLTERFLFLAPLLEQTKQILREVYGEF